MKLKPYKQILKMAKEAIDDVLAPVRAHKAKKQVELELAKLEEKIAIQETKIHELCVEKELDINKILNAQDELALNERRKKQFDRVIKELFPDED